MRIFVPLLALVTVSIDVTASTASVSQRKCVGAEVAAYGDCSSKFKRCRNGIWTGARCPGATVFDANLGLCVYDMPLCKTSIFNPVIPANPSIDQSSPSYYGIEQTALPYNSPSSSISYAGEQMESQFTSPESNYISNPFFALRHKNGRHRNHREHSHDTDNKVKSNKGKLRYSSRSTRIDDRTHRVDDGLDGKAEHHIQQNYQPTFPRSYKHKKTSLKNVWETISDDSSEKEFDEPLLVTDVEEKALVGELEDLIQEEGSGDFPDDNDETKRTRRSYSLGSAISLDVSICSNQLDGAFVSVGSCRQDFIFCPTSGTQIRAACPVGDLFDSKAKLCVLQESCGEEKSFDGAAVSESFTGASINTQRVGNTLIGGDPCEGRINGPLALGCSVSYLHCESYVGIEMACPGGLVFDEGRNVCDYQENVAICGGTNVDSPFAGNSRPVALPYSSVDSIDDRRPYKPVEESSTPLSIPTPAAITRFSAYRPVSTTPKVAPYLASTYAPSAAATNPSVVPYLASTYAPSTMTADPRVAKYLTAPYSQQQPVQYADLTTYSSTVESIYPTVVQSSTVDVKKDMYPTSSSDQDALPTRLVQCSSEEPTAFGNCDKRYTVCSEGVDYVMSCGHPLVFDPIRRMCDHSEYVSGCSQAKPVTATTAYNTVPDSATKWMSVDVKKDMYPTSSSDQDALPTRLVECSSEEPTAFGNCDKRYTVCSKGVDYVMSCGHPLVFDSIRRMCDHSEFVSGCSQAKPVTATTAYNTVPDSATKGASQCDPRVDSSPFATGFCSNRFAFCNSNGVVSYEDCALGNLFDGTTRQCVIASDCGKNAYTDAVVITTTAISPALDSRCVGKRDNSFFSERECSTTYFHCAGGAASSMNCRKHEVFSARKGRCVAKFLVRECIKKVQYVIGTTGQESFCKDRVDGLYRNPADCTSILQCFGGDMFKTAGCASGLVFNEKTKQCDYRQNVPGCDAAQDPKIDSGCRGFEHGAYIADKEECTIFYRCVWDRLEKMHCPGGTVFNPALSVCDYISNVPSCKTNTPLINSYY